MSDQTYFELMKIAQDHKVSMGKLINRILNDYVEKHVTKEPPKCEVCGQLATFEVLIGGKWLHYCEFHIDKKEAKAYKKLDNTS